MSCFPCPACSAGTRVVDTRGTKRNAIGPIRRRRECHKCGHRITTFEVDQEIAKAMGGGNLERALGTALRSIQTLRKAAGLEKAPPPRTRNRIVWTPEMDNALIEMRSHNHSYLDCGERIGVSYMLIAQRCRHLGVGGKRNNGRTSGPATIIGANHEKR